MFLLCIQNITLALPFFIVSYADHWNIIKATKILITPRQVVSKFKQDQLLETQELSVTVNDLRKLQGTPRIR